MIWFLYKGSNSLKWAYTTEKIHKFPDISGGKIPENGQITAISGALFKHLGNLFVFCNLLTRKSHEICGVFLAKYINENIVVLKLSSLKSILSKVASQIVESYQIDTFTKVLFAYFSSRNQWSGSYIKEAIAWNAPIPLKKYTDFLTFLVTKFQKSGRLHQFQGHCSKIWTFVFCNFLTRKSHEICGFFFG